MKNQLQKMECNYTFLTKIIFTHLFGGEYLKTLNESVNGEMKIMTFNK